MQNSSCHSPSNKSVFLQILHHSSLQWKITPLYFFSSNNIYFAQKEPMKVKNFETFECLAQNLSNSLCQFWNDSSPNFGFLFSFMKDSSSALFLVQAIYTLLKRNTLKWKFGDFQVLRSKFVKFLMSTLKWQVSSSSNFV